MDINPQTLDWLRNCANGTGTRTDFAAKSMPPRPREGTQDAKYVICCARIVCLEGFITDVESP
jgi:hypothetical protein